MRAVQIVVTVVALTALLAHVLVPDFSLDAVGLALIVLAVAPWLGAILEGFEIGDTKIRYRDIADKVDRVEGDLERTQDSLGALDGRVERVESFVFTGAGTATQRDRLASALASYRRHLEGIGLDPSPLMDIYINPDEPAASYPDEEGKRFVIGAAMADQTDVLLHEYTHYVLARMASAPRDQWDSELRGVESGLTYYLPASATNNPVHAGWVNLLDVDPVVGHAHDPAHRAGMRWASALWELRNDRGPDPLDRDVVAAWRAVWRDDDPGARSFVRALAKPATSTRDLEALLGTHGVGLRADDHG